MAKKKLVLMIDKPHFVVKLHENLLEVDLKEGVKKKLENVLEANTILRESLGVLFQTIIPLDVAVNEVDSAEVDDKGQLKIVIPSRRDIVIPLEFNESTKLAKKLNELVLQVGKRKEKAKLKKQARERRRDLLIKPKIR